MWVLSLLAWWAVLALLTPIGLAVQKAAFGEVADSHYPTAKLYGLSAVTAALWIGAYLRLPILQPLVLLPFFLVASGAAMRWLRATKTSLDGSRIAKSEFLFAALVAVYVAVRGFNPSVFEGEIPANLAILSSNLRATALPPEDAWFAGRSLSTDYYGHFAFASVAKTAGLSSFLAFNFGLAALWSGLLFVLWGIGRELTGSRRWAALVPGLYAFSANLGPLRQIMSPSDAGGFDWWAASRLAPNAATEFPAFSFLLGDFGARAMAPLWIGLAILSLARIRSHGQPPPVFALTLGFLFAQSLTTDRWSVLTIIGLGLAWRVLRPVRLKEAALFLAGFALIAAPFYAHQPLDLGPLTLARDRISLAVGCLQWILLLGGVYAYFMVKPIDRFVSVLAIVGGVLAILPQFIAAGGTRGPMNFQATEWGQAWLLWSIVAACGFTAISRLHWAGRVWTAACVGAGCLYLPLALPARYGGFGHWYGGDPAVLAFLRFPYLEVPYRTLSQEHPRGVYEAPSESHTEGALLSALTGVPTYIGWVSHEKAWRRGSREPQSRIDRATAAGIHAFPEVRAGDPPFDYLFLNGRLTRLPAPQ